jgi:hypothetical protein
MSRCLLSRGGRATDAGPTISSLASIERTTSHLQLNLGDHNNPADVIDALFLETFVRAEGTTSETKAKVAFTATKYHENSQASGDGLNVISAKITGTVEIYNQDGGCFNQPNPQLPSAGGAIPIKDEVAKGTQTLNPSELADAYFSGDFIRPMRRPGCRSPA